MTEIDVLPESNIPRRTRYRKRRSPNVSIYTSHQSVNPFSEFGFTSTMSSCRDGPNFHECTTVTNNGGNRRNGQGGKKTVIVKVSLTLFCTDHYMACFITFLFEIIFHKITYTQFYSVNLNSTNAAMAIQGIPHPDSLVAQR